MLLDLRNRDNFLQHMQPYSILEKGDDLMIDRLSFDPLTGMTTNRRIYLKDGQRIDAPFSMTCYNYTDIVDMISPLGFKILEVMEHWSGVAFTAASKRMLLVMEKPA